MKVFQITCIIGISLLLYACPTQENTPQPQNQPQEDKAQQLAKDLAGTWGREVTGTTYIFSSIGEEIRAKYTDKDKWTISWQGKNSIEIQATNTVTCSDYYNTGQGSTIGVAPGSKIVGKIPPNPILSGTANTGTINVDATGNVESIFYLRFVYTNYKGEKSYNEITVSKAQLQLLGNNTLNVVDRQASKVLMQLKRD